MFSFAAGLSTELTRMRIRTILTFSLGCGADSTDLRNLRGSHVTLADNGTVLVDIRVSGSRPRQVPVLARYEQAAWKLAREAGTSPLLGGKPGIRARPDTIISNAWKQDRVGVPLPSVQRLRITWLVDLLLAGVRLDVVSQASGVSVGHMDRYLRFLTPPLPVEHAHAALRGARS